jgi:hypothetical protein
VKERDELVAIGTWRNLERRGGKRDLTLRPQVLGEFSRGLHTMDKSKVYSQGGYIAKSL